jgi:AbrB family looped-hinge helix DNA binding protein
MLMGITLKVGPKGQVVIPSYLRKTLGITPGKRVIVELGEGEVIIRPVREGVAERLWNLVPEREKLRSGKIDVDKFYEEELKNR